MNGGPLALAVLGALAWSAATLAGEPAWEAPYAFRRPLAVPGGQKWTEAGIAHAFFRVGDVPPESAGRVLVADENGRPVPAHVLFAAPRRQASVLFAASEGRSYAVYFGPEGDAPASPPLEVKRGLLLETRLRPPGACRTAAEMQRLLEKATGVCGAGPERHVFLGHNPYGTSKGFVGVFRGWLRVPAAGKYGFATASSDGSFVFVDGREVVSWPGPHNPLRGAYGEIKGEIELTEGLHELAYFWESAGDTPTACLYWLPPGETRPSLVPPEAFPGFLESRAGALERRDGLPAADFEVFPEGAARVASAYLYAVKFRASGKAAGGLAWDFGDGLSAGGPKADHVFVGERTYRVALRGAPAGEGAAAEFAQDLDASVLLPYWKEPKDPKGYLDLMRSYEAAKMDAAAVAALLGVFREWGTWKDVAPLAEDLLGRGWSPPGGRRAELGFGLARLEIGLGRPDKALAAVEAVRADAEREGRGPEAAYAEALCGFLAGKRPAEEALAWFLGLAEKPGALPESARRGWLGAAEVKLAQGDWKSALEFVRKAHAARAKPLPEAQALVAKGDFGSEVLARLQAKEFEKAREKLFEWEFEFPEERAEGYTADLRARSCLGDSDWAGAVAAADAFLRLGRDTNFTAPLLYKKGAALWASGRKEDAAAALSDLLARFPEAPERANAERLLERIKAEKR